MSVTTRRAVSRGYCVREFDRRKAQLDPGMAEDQKKYDLHFTGVAYDARYPVVWVGLTSFLGDILWTFDPKTKQFASRNFTPLREKEEVKVHRGLQVGPDGLVYFGTAGLITVPQRHEAPGGRLFRYDPRQDAYEFLGRPLAHDYIVFYGRAWDEKRQTGIYRPHELVLGPGPCLYCPETDNPERLCYFWETALRR